MQNARSGFRWLLVLGLMVSGVAANAHATPVVIGEVRLRGPNGGNDEFVELFNASAVAVDVGGWKIKGSSAGGAVAVRATLPAGTMLGPGCHYLVTNSGGPYSGGVVGDLAYTLGIADDGGIALTLANDGIVDQVGMSTGSAFKEGGTLTPLTTNQDRSYERRPGGFAGNGTDTDDNANDFVLVVPSGPQSSLSPCVGTSPSVSPTSSSTPTATISVSPTASATASVSATPSFTTTSTATVVPTETPTEMPTATAMATATETATETASPTTTPSSSPSPSAMDSPTETPTQTATRSPMPTTSPTESAPPTVSASPTVPQSPTESASITPTESPTNSPSASPTASASPTNSEPALPSATTLATATPSPRASSCGDGFVDRGEQCDDGNRADGDECPATCHFGRAGWLIRGNQRPGAANREGCVAEWQVGARVPRLDRGGMPAASQDCDDQDGSCDADTSPGRCRLLVRLCFNNEDIHFPECKARAIKRVDVLAPRGVANRSSLTSALEQLAPTLLSVDERDRCTPPFPIDISLGGRRLAREQLLVRAFDVGAGRGHLSRLRLSCRARLR